MVARIQTEAAGTSSSRTCAWGPRAACARCTAADATLEVSLDDTTRRYGLDDAGAVEAIANATWGRAPASYLTRAHAIRVGLAALAETDRLPDLVDAV